MRIAVIGAGGVGGYLRRQARAGGPRRHVRRARPRTSTRIREHGLVVESGDRQLHRRAGACGRPTTRRRRAGRRRDVLRQAVGRRADRAGARAAAVAAAAWSSRSRTASTARRSLQRALGDDKVLGGVAYIAATIRAPGVIAHTGTMARLARRRVRRAARAAARRAFATRARRPASTCEIAVDIRPRAVGEIRVPGRDVRRDEPRAAAGRRRARAIPTCARPSRRRCAKRGRRPRAGRGRSPTTSSRSSSRSSTRCRRRCARRCRTTSPPAIGSRRRGSSGARRAHGADGRRRRRRSTPRSYAALKPYVDGTAPLTGAAR